jgi:hypothetical protein
MAEQVPAGSRTNRSLWSRADPTRPRPSLAALAGYGGYGEGELRDALRAWFPRTRDRNCVTIIDHPPRNARSAGAREARRHRAWRLAMGTSSKRALRGEVRTAVAASRRWYPSLVLRPVFLANKIKHNLVLSWHSHSAIVRGLCILRQ